MWILRRPSNRRSGTRTRSGALAVLAAASSACLYGFAGGGMPPHIRTVAILPFDNQTGEPSLTNEVAEAVRSALQDRLGLRAAGEQQADAVVRGTISDYQAGVPLSFQTTTAGNASVTRRLVLIVLSVEIYDRREDRPLWQRNGLRIEGEYQPPGEARGRELALERLVTDIVDGAQSQW